MSGFHGGHSSGSSGGFHGGSSSGGSSHSSSGSSHSSGGSGSYYSSGDYDGSDGTPLGMFFAFALCALGFSFFITFVQLSNRNAGTAFGKAFLIVLLVLYLICSLFVMVFGSLFRDLARKSFVVGKEKKLISELKDEEYKNKRGTLYLIIIGITAAVAGTFIILLISKLDSIYIIIGFLYMLTGGGFIGLGYFIRNKFLSSICFIDDLNEDGKIDEADLLVYIEELEDNRKKQRRLANKYLKVRYCKFCGTKIAEKASYCKSCGGYLGE